MASAPRRSIIKDAVGTPDPHWPWGFRMFRRSRAREVVLQLLYRFDLNGDRTAEVEEAFLRRRLREQEDLIGFARALLQGVLRNKGELDELLAQRADHWSLDRMAVTDRNVLRLGAYELLYTETPGKVVINEAVELARRFGSAQSSQFVNGILDRFMKPEQGRAANPLP